MISAVLEHALAGAEAEAEAEREADAESEADAEAEAEAEGAGAGGARAWAACCVVRAVKRAPLSEALRAQVPHTDSVIRLLGPYSLPSTRD